MSNIARLSGGLIAAACLAAPSAQAQMLTQRNVSTAQAMAIVSGVIAECNKNGVAVSVAVVDRAGQVKALEAGDGAAPHNLDLARRKAYTARTFRMTSLAWAARTKQGMDLEGQRQLVDVIPLGGGVPIMVGMEAIGAIGISGTAGGQQGDEDCAKMGLAKIANDLK